MRFGLMKKIRWWVLLVMALFAGRGNLLAQQLNVSTGYAFKDNWAVQLQPGFSQFYGDATNHNYLQKFNGQIAPAGDVSVRKMLLPALGVGFYAGYAGLKSFKDRKTDGTKVDFTLNGSYYDAGLFVYLDFNHLFAGYKPGRRFTVYGMLGLGWGFWNSSLTDGITGLTIKSGSTIGTRTFKTNALAVPAGLGVNWHLSDRLTVSLGGTLRTVFSDDVDVWHDGFKYDQIFTTHVGIAYHIRPGWGRSSGPAKTRRKKEACCNQNEKFEKGPLLPIYDFDQVKVASAPVKPAGRPAVAELHPVPVHAAKAGSPPVEFRVQILAVSKPLPHASSLRTRYHLPYAVVETHQDGLYRYSVGSFQRYSDALNAARQIKKQGVFDAFVTAYRNGLRIPLTAEMKKDYP